ncbi:hypothetical protein M427DRAFT_136169 [Gonapodya prolifera JEL478]|uniref:Uncharacterized protein n=1 Tax=Gonapodya prolifera (strain JEL478) TaxID=1344416 RepID=A0A139AAT2_GONPJ|nr:hypothetical protein M427DRAFT_136169 [Gonapodya prolifera JEL478]|eukprot:KXS13860.1 hypothetical protein M427DRAFT_136169 [Gonapodya prolifera JEL478]
MAPLPSPPKEECSAHRNDLWTSACIPPRFSLSTPPPTPIGCFPAESSASSLRPRSILKRYSSLSNLASHNRSISFNQTVLVAFTYHGDDYDRQCVPAAKLTPEEAREVIEMRWEFSLLTHSLLAQRALMESRQVPSAARSLHASPYPSHIPQRMHHRRSSRHIQPHPPIGGSGWESAWELPNPHTTGATAPDTPPAKQAFDYAEAFAAHFNVPSDGRAGVHVGYFSGQERSPSVWGGGGDQ